MKTFLANVVPTILVLATIVSPFLLLLLRKKLRKNHWSTQARHR